jgi:KH/beta-lactamase-domain protein
MDYIKQIKETVSDNLPKEAMVTNVELEGPEIAIYTKNPKVFFENENFVAKIAFDLKKRINVRTDKTLLEPDEVAAKKIKEIVPQEAEIRDISFNPAFSEVVIEAIKPGLVIGKGGETSKQIILKTGWTPNIIRAPTSESKILKGLRNHLHKYSSERKKILQETAKRIYREVDVKPGKEWVRLHALGGFREVGRSCIMIETPVTKILLDCGVNVANSDDPYPLLESLNFPMSELDAVVVAHAHLDHSGMVPYLFKMGFKGPVYCTSPTRDLMSLLQFDYIDVLVKEGKEPIYSERDIKEMAKYCIPRSFREVTDIAPDIRLTLHNAAHILGSSSVHLHIGEGAHNLVYTSDFKYGFTRLFNNIDMKYPRLETLIIESTYGGRDDFMPRRLDAEENLIQIIKETVQTGGNVLIPVFSVGRAQEIMLILEQYYKNNGLDAKVYVDGMTKEASAVHTAYPEYLRKSVQRRTLQNDSPFTSDLFQEATWEKRDEIVKQGSAVILASSGMLTGGPSVEYLRKMAGDPNSTLVFVGYQGEGSPGRKIQRGVKTIPYVGQDKKTKAMEVKIRIETVEGFSGHCDRNELSNYIRNLKPKPKLVLIDHGERSKCHEFAKYINNRYKINAMAPQNLDAVRLR